MAPVPVMGSREFESPSSLQFHRNPSMLDPRILALILFACGLSITHRKALEATDPLEKVVWTAGMFLTTTITLNFLLTTYGR